MTNLHQLDDVSSASDAGSVSPTVSLFSTESDFIGDSITRKGYSESAAVYNPSPYWHSIHEWNLQVVAERSRVRQPMNAAKSSKRKREDVTDPQMPKKTKIEATSSQKLSGSTANPSKSTVSEHGTSPLVPTTSIMPKTQDRAPQNPYEDLELSKKLSESIDSFLIRLPPSTTPLKSGPWIWVANPFPLAQESAASRNMAPESGTDASDVGTFRQSGFALLETYLNKKRELEDEGKAATVVTRVLRPDRLQLEDDIKALARRTGITAGKWMLFPSPDHVDEVWKRVVKGVWDNKLGTAAKVATHDDAEPHKQRLICIYTADFGNKADVKRALLGLKELGLVGERADDTSDAKGKGGQIIYYKCDAYTYLDIMSGNEFKLKASLYSSKDMLA